MGKRKINWRLKVLLSILAGIIAVITLLFGITYNYFLGKLKSNDEKITYITFQESENKLKELLERASEKMSRFSMNDLAYEFGQDVVRDRKIQPIYLRSIIQEFDEILNSDSTLYSVALMNGDGRTILSTVEKKSRAGVEVISEELSELFAESKKAYPYVVWVSGNDLNTGNNGILYTAVNRPVIVGIKALNEEEKAEKDNFMLIALDEKEVRKCYNQAIYNDSDALLLDSRNQVISSTREELIDTFYIAEEGMRSIDYSLSYYGWRLLNVLPENMYLEEARDIRNFGIMIAVAAVLCMILIAAVWSKRYTKPIQTLMEQMDCVGKEQLDISEPIPEGWPELSELNRQFYHMVQRLKDYIDRLQKAEKEKSEEELLALQYQMNPHFLYNSLNSIRWMAMMTKNTTAADALVILSRIIEPVLRNPDFTWKLKDELDFLKDYIEMMSLRFDNCLEYQMECSEELYDEEFPRFVLQPIIENCFVHGKSCNTTKSITGHIIKEEDIFKIVIRNDGSPIDGDKLEELNIFLKSGQKTSSTIGLSNVYKRLRLLYGDTVRIWMESDIESTACYITFCNKIQKEMLEKNDW